MADHGPPIAQLTRRLAECPAAFLEEPRMGASGRVHVDAVVGDLLLELGAPLPEPGVLDAFTPGQQSARNFLRLVLICAWLLHDPFFVAAGTYGAASLQLFREQLRPLADLVDAQLFLTDPERREELSRRVLAALRLVPEGENENTARDRLMTLDSIERVRLLAESRKQQERLEAIRQKLKEQAAQEAAAKISRE